MTGSDIEVDDINAVGHLLRDVQALMLDFDGPICSVFAGFPASVVASQLRDILLEGNDQNLPEEVRTTSDPFGIFWYASTVSDDVSRYIERALSAHEIEAVASAAATPGIKNLIDAWRSRGRRLAIVSNNGTGAIESYLHREATASSFELIVGRESFDPGLLKPNSWLVRQAVNKLNVDSKQCAFVGDTVSDLQASNEAGVPFIAYANKPGKSDAFRNMGAKTIITRMSTITEAVLSIP